MSPGFVPWGGGAEKGAATLYPGEGKRRKDPQPRTPGNGSGERSRNIVPWGQGRRYWGRVWGGVPQRYIVPQRGEAEKGPPNAYSGEGKRRKEPQNRTPGRGSGERSRNIVPQGGRRGERSPKVGREGQRRKDLKTEPVTRLKCMQTWIDRDSTLVVTSDDQKEFLGNLRCRQRTTTTVE